MRLKSVIMTGGLAGAAFVIAGHAAAESAGAPSTNAQIRAQQAQIDYMKRQIQLMQDKLDQMQAATKATQQTVQATAAAIAQPAPRVTESATHRLAIESADGQYSIGLTGRLHLDIGDYANFDPKSKYVGPQDLNSGFDARRARIGVVGKVAGDWTYGLIYDFGNSADNTNAGIQTAQIAYSGFKDFSAEFGYSDTFFTLDEATSSNDIMFLERATPQVVAANVNTGDFRSNAGVRYMNDRFWLGAYFTGPKNGDVHNQGETIGAFQRATVQALQDPDYSLHLGVGVDEIIKAAYAGGATATAPSTNTFALSDQPDLRIDTTTLLNTGQLGSVGHPVTGGYIADVEAAGGIGSLFAQGEYFHYSIDRTGLKTAEFDGEYGEASYTLTGESRKYKKDSGAYSGIVPDHPFSLEEGTWGAFEVAGRVSYIDLTSNFTPGLPISSTSQPSAVNGGKQTSFTAGLNWYPNSYMRFMLDYVHVDFDKANPSTAGKALIGSPVGATMDAIALRSQVAW